MKTKSLLFLSGFLLLAACAGATVPQDGDPLKFTAEGQARALTMPDGKIVNYIAYEHIYYVTNVEDSTYQYLNYYVPEAAADPKSDVPILLRNYVGGYMASKAHGPSGTDATGRALSEGYAVCIPGARDRDTSFPVPVNLATKLWNNGYDVDFALPWNRPHSGDYNLDDLFCWIARISGNQ